MDLVFDDWIKFGYDKGWITDVFCNTHEGPPLSEEELDKWESGEDPCSFHVRVLELE